VEKNINMAALVLLKLLSAQTHNISLPAEPKTWPTAEPIQKWPLLACAKHINISGLFPTF
jgi:hypothetical protein